MDVDIRFDGAPYDGFTEISSHEMADFVKRRYTNGDVTVDIALMPVDPDAVDAAIAERRDEIATMDIAVPAPYTSEVEEKPQDPDHPLEFHDTEPPHGTGYADPEYRPLVADTDQIARYRYLVTWRYVEEADVLAEIEVYVPVDAFDPDTVRGLADAITFS